MAGTGPGTYDYLPPEERVEITQEAARLQLELTRLNRRINAGSLVMRLPNELLAEIFILCTGLNWNPESPFVLELQAVDDSCSPRYKWLRLTHVCHRWREVALNIPALWTEIDVTNPELVASFVARSRNLPLEISLCQLRRQHLPAAIWEPVVQAVSRARSFTLHIRSGRDAARPTPQLHQDYTLSELQDLKLHNMCADQIALPYFLLPAFQFPALRVLFVSQFYYRTIQHLLVPSLRSLTLQAPYIRSGSDWEPLLKSLGEMKALQDLSIEDVYPLPENYTEMPLLANTVARLPSLQSLRIPSRHDAGVAAALLLQSLCFPGNAALRIGGRDRIDLDFQELEPSGTSIEEDVSCLLRALETRLSGEGTRNFAPPPPIRTLHLTFTDQGPREMFITAWSSVLLSHELFTLEPLMPTNLPHPCLTVEGPLDTTRIDVLLQMLGLAPSLWQHVRSLSITLPPCDGGSSVWQRPDLLHGVYAHFHHLRSLFVSGVAAVHTLLALQIPHELSPQDRVLPLLDHLHLCGYDFGVDTRGDVGREGGGDEGYNILKTTLEDRAQSGLPIHTLALSLCRGVERYLDEDFRELVPNLVWDGAS